MSKGNKSKKQPESDPAVSGSIDTKRTPSTAPVGASWATNATW